MILVPAAFSVRSPLDAVARVAGARGFGLAETLVASALLAVSFAAALGAFSSGVRALAFAEREATAVFLAEEKLELIRAWALGTGPGQGFASIAPGGACSDGPCRAEADGIPGHPGFRRAATITPVTASLTLVEVAVIYQAVPPQRVTLATLVAAR